MSSEPGVGLESLTWYQNCLIGIISYIQVSTMLETTSAIRQEEDSDCYLSYFRHPTMVTSRMNNFKLTEWDLAT